MSTNSADRYTGCDSPVRVEKIDLDPALQEARVRRDAVALFDHDDVARDELGHLDLLSLPIPDDRGLRGQVPTQRLDGAFRLSLLDEGEAGVQDDDREDRDRQRRSPRDERQSGRDPEEERQRMRQLDGQLPRPAASSSPLELVRAVRDQAPLRLAARQSVGARAQVAQEKRDGLARIAHRKHIPHGGRLGAHPLSMVVELRGKP